MNFHADTACDGENNENFMAACDARCGTRRCDKYVARTQISSHENEVSDMIELE